jgi:proline iminopeptidase
MDCIWWFVGLNTRTGISTKTPREMRWLDIAGSIYAEKRGITVVYQSGADRIYPDYYDVFKEVIPVEERGDMLKAYYTRLMGDNEEEKLKW